MAESANEMQHIYDDESQRGFFLGFAIDFCTPNYVGPPKQMQSMCFFPTCDAVRRLPLGSPSQQFFSFSSRYCTLHSSSQRKMFVLLLLSSFLTLVSADVYCSALIPSYAVPPLASCDAAILALEQTGAVCGPGRLIFGPTSSGPLTVRLPVMYIGQQDVRSVSELICVISILWQPKPGERPPTAEFDIFTFSNIITAAYNIRNQCIKRSEHFNTRLGRAYIEPNEWVDVQFGSVLGPRRWPVNASDAESGGLTMMLADGSNQTFASSMLGQVGGCGAVTGLENGFGANISETS